jgi:hypothetical protein
MKGYNVKKIIAAFAAVLMGTGIALASVAAPASAVEEPIVLPSPVQIDECGTENDRIETPEVDGVLYGVYNYTGSTGTGWLANPANNYGWEPGDSWLVIAGPDNWGFFDDTPTAPEGDYGVDSRGNIGWWFPAFTDAPCEVEPILVTPERPRWSDPAGPGNATVIYTDQPSHHYVITYPPNGRIRVTAIANEGYAFTEGAQTVWGRPEMNL